VAEHPFWRQARLTYEELDKECPDGQRTVALVHLVSGEVFEANHVRPDALTDPEWVWIQSDYPGPPEVRFVRVPVIGHVEMKYVRSEKPSFGFKVGE